MKYQANIFQLKLLKHQPCGPYSLPFKANDYLSVKYISCKSILACVWIASEEAQRSYFFRSIKWAISRICTTGEIVQIFFLYLKVNADEASKSSPFLAPHLYLKGRKEVDPVTIALNGTTMPRPAVVKRTDNFCFFSSSSLSPLTRLFPFSFLNSFFASFHHFWYTLVCMD